MTRPGDRLRAFAARWCCPNTLTRFIDPLAADLQHEHTHATREGRVWRSRAIRIAGWVAFFKVVVICAWTGELAPDRWTADDRRAFARAIAYSTLLTVAMTALLNFSPLSFAARHWWAAGARWLYLIPQAMPLAMIIGVTLGVLFGVGGRPFSRRVAEGMMAVALAASVLSFVNLGWITPASNQAFRVAANGRPDLPKGTRELTLGELSHAIDIVRREPTEPSAQHFGYPLLYLRDLTLNYHYRWALSLAPLIFAALAILIAHGVSRKRWLLGLLTRAAFFGYYALLYAGRALVLAGTVPAFVGVWFANAILAAITAVLIFRSGRNAHYEPAR